MRECRKAQPGLTVLLSSAHSVERISKTVRKSDENLLRLSKVLSRVLPLSACSLDSNANGMLNLIVFQFLRLPSDS